MGFADISKVPHMYRQYPLESSLNDRTVPALPQPQGQSTPPTSLVKSVMGGGGEGKEPSPAGDQRLQESTDNPCAW